MRAGGACRDGVARSPSAASCRRALAAMRPSAAASAEPAGRAPGTSRRTRAGARAGPSQPVVDPPAQDRRDRGEVDIRAEVPAELGEHEGERPDDDHPVQRATGDAPPRTRDARRRRSSGSSRARAAPAPGQRSRRGSPRATSTPAAGASAGPSRGSCRYESGPHTEQHRRPRHDRRRRRTRASAGSPAQTTNGRHPRDRIRLEGDGDREQAAAPRTGRLRAERRGRRGSGGRRSCRSSRPSRRARAAARGRSRRGRSAGPFAARSPK